MPNGHFRCVQSLLRVHIALGRTGEGQSCSQGGASSRAPLLGRAGGHGLWGRFACNATAALSRARTPPSPSHHPKNRHTQSHPPLLLLHAVSAPRLPLPLQILQGQAHERPAPLRRRQAGRGATARGQRRPGGGDQVFGRSYSGWGVPHHILCAFRTPAKAPLFCN